MYMVYELLKTSRYIRDVTKIIGQYVKHTNKSELTLARFITAVLEEETCEYHGNTTNPLQIVVNME